MIHSNRTVILAIILIVYSQFRISGAPHNQIIGVILKLDEISILTVKKLFLRNIFLQISA